VLLPINSKQATWRSCIVSQWYTRPIHDSKPDGFSIGIGTIAAAV
jgi:hypothetical protein